MIIRIQHNRENPYVQIHKALLEDRDLSWAAKGLLCYLLSRPDNWKISTEHLSKIYQGSGKGNGIKGLRSIIKELIAIGYCEYFQNQHADGKYAEGEYVIREFKKCLPHCPERNAVEWNSVNDTLIKNEVKEKEISKKKEKNKQKEDRVSPSAPPPAAVAAPTKLLSSSKATEFPEEVIGLGKTILQKMKEVKPDFDIKKGTLNAFFGAIDALTRIDRRSTSKILDVVSWIVSDGFWKSKLFKPNPAKYLREKFDQLELQMLEKPSRRNGPTGQSGSGYYDNLF
jgi:hypothetical protein